MRLHTTLFSLIIFNLFFAFSLCSNEKPQVVNLNEDNWDLMLKKEWMVEFYAPWCPACKNLVSTWEEFSVWAGKLNIKTAKIDVTDSPGLSGRFFVTALPTIFHVVDGQFRQYKGARDLNSLMTFIEDKKWQGIEPVSALSKPDSIQMSVVSYFFKLSHYMKEVNNSLLKEYGLPSWASYAIFAIVTILLGAILGLLLVCIIDFFFPPKMSQRQSFSESKDSDNKELSGDEIQDELEDEDESDGEKYSGSDSESEESKKSPPGSPKQGKESKNVSPKASPEVVRKRKPRKAD